MHTPKPSLLAVRSAPVLTSVLVATLVAWAVAVEQMQGWMPAPAPTSGRSSGFSASG